METGLVNQEQKVSSSRRHFGLPALAVFASGIALGLGAPESAAQDQLPPPPQTDTPTPEQVQFCQQQAVFSFTGAKLKLVENSKGAINPNRVEQIVRARSLSADCRDIVSRTVKVTEVMGQDDDEWRNTKLATIDQGTRRFNKDIIQKRFRAFTCGRFIKQFIRFTSTPVGGGKAVTKDYVSDKALFRC